MNLDPALHGPTSGACPDRSTLRGPGQCRYGHRSAANPRGTAGPGSRVLLQVQPGGDPTVQAVHRRFLLAISTLMGDDKNRDNFFHNNFGTDPFWRWLSYAALYLPVKFLRDLLKKSSTWISFCPRQQ